MAISLGEVCCRSNFLSFERRAAKLHHQLKAALQAARVFPVVDTDSIMDRHASPDTQPVLTIRQLWQIMSLLHTLPGYHGSNKTVT